MTYIPFKKLIYFFQSLLRNYATSPELSKIINQYLDDPETDIIIVSKYHCILKNPKFNNLPLWIGNYPYAYGYVSMAYETTEDLKFYEKLNTILGTKLPDRKTVYRLNERIEEIKKQLPDYHEPVEQRLREILNMQ